MVARDLIGHLEGGERLEQGVQRAAKQSRLLAGDDRDGARIGELARGFDGANRRLTPPLLRADDVGDLRVRPRNGSRARDRLGPRGVRRRIARIERRDRRKVVGVVGGEPFHPRKAADIDRDSNG